MVKVGSISSQKVPGIQSLSTWKEQLFQLSSSLNVLTTTTEDEFLAIGLDDHHLCLPERMMEKTIK